MNVQVKSSNGITLVPIESRLLTDRKIFIEGEINHEKACDFVKQLLLLCKEDCTKTIDVLINSPGGEISSGLLMYDCIQSCTAPIRMYCMGTAYSMGALLFASGNHGRYMLPHSELMLHEPLLGSGVRGNASSIRSISDSLMETRSKMNLILAKHTGKTVEEIEEATGFDHYFNPDESVAFGLADEIVNFDKLMEV
ncbi:MAG: ATP-dependent Clp protease proteolytic subunit [Oscillospiraceae bacterium]|nr:ATP-dependent Clp protease proteolytic subunit [Oscillospiraceae bacterium]